MGLVTAWKRFWFSKHDPLPAALFRLCGGFLLVLIYLGLYPNWFRYYAPDGVLSLHDKDIRGLPDDAWSIFYWLDPHVPFQLFWWIGILAAIAFMVGFYTRTATIIMYVMVASVLHRNRMAINGEDLVFRMLLLYCCFYPMGLKLSVDAWLARRKGRPIDEPNNWPKIWPVRCMQIQIALIYFISLPHKIADDEAWINGQAIYLSMVNSLWSRQLFPSLFYGGFLSVLGTYFTVVVEGLFAFLVWFRPTRLWIILAIAGMHIGIAVALQNVTFFSLTMVASYWLFFPASELHERRDQILSLVKKVVPGIEIAPASHDHTPQELQLVPEAAMAQATIHPVTTGKSKKKQRRTNKPAA